MRWNPILSYEPPSHTSMRRATVPDVPVPKVLGQEDIQRWLFGFQRAIRSEDYEAGKKLFHRNVVGFGTNVTRADSLETLVEHQWRARWPNNGKFEYLVKDVRVIPAPGLFVIALEWFVPSVIVGGHTRLGRATFVLADFDGKLLCVHSHHSEAP